MTHHTMLWRRLDRPGHESARLTRHESGWQLEGAAVFAYEQQPCCLNYRVVCDAAWQTVAGRVAGWVGSTAVAVDISVDAERRWFLNGAECANIAGCTDLDLNFSPSTNSLPIRRLCLEGGQAAPVRAAWLRFPSFAFEPLDQVYTRTGATAYRYESAGGAFVADLSVNEIGFVTNYPNIWQAETGG